MRTSTIFPAALLAALGVSGLGLAQGQTGSSAPAHAHVFFHIQTAHSVGTTLSGRMLIFVKQGSGDKEVSVDEFHPQATWVAAKEVTNVAPGGIVEVDADDLAYPKGFSAMPSGTYEAQAVLDGDHSYNYGGRDSEDWISAVVPLADWTPGNGAEPVLTIDHHPEKDPKRAAAEAKTTEAAKAAEIQPEELTSELLSRFWGSPVSLKAWVLLPPGYAAEKSEKYPTAYWTHGFGGNFENSLGPAVEIQRRMKDGRMPPMIWVFLDESVPQGTHEFADSVNNGPWGTALTTEFIPYLESKYRMDAKPTGRLLNGHSSGGWATLQLQVNYPTIFGGTWSTSPDPSDFHAFSGVNLYAANANLYRAPDGSAVPIFREKGKVIATMQQFGQLEVVLGPYGGQLSSFDWVFSPKGPDGGPAPMFDRQTGNVDPKVVAYWHDHYDLAHLVESDWARRGPDLRGRIHLIVGTADTFYLDGAAHKFEAVLTRLAAEPHFTYLPDRSHFDLYGVGDDRRGLFNQIGAEMYAVARPGVDWKKK